VTLKTERPVSHAYPKFLITLGDHLRKRRLDLKLLQKEVAQKVGASETSIYNWENNRSTPSLCFLPKVIDFLDYTPYNTKTGSLGVRIKNYRKLLGLNQKKLARFLDIDPGTLSRWERDERQPNKNTMEKLKGKLNS
jgi:transcriptional regulator with XRE-family HTH domain